MICLNRYCLSLIRQPISNLGPKQALQLLTPTQRRHKTDTRPSATYFEVSGAVGGSESMLFAAEMLDLYLKYFKSMQWPFELEEESKSEIGGIHNAKLTIYKDGIFESLVQEGGVHRVQRVPKTEKSGRIHTSTITVSVIPKSVMSLTINDRDLEITTMRSSGPGGQHVNKTESAVRILHKPSGIAVDAQVTRSQLENKQIALDKLIDKLKSHELDKIVSKSENLRRSQVGSANRNEKIRTYNFPQDRVTDHRINKSYQGLRRMMSGDTTLLNRLVQDFHAHNS